MKKTRKMRKAKNIVLWMITAIMGFTMAVSASCLDTEGTWVFLIAFMISGVWIGLFACVNRDYF